MVATNTLTITATAPVDTQPDAQLTALTALCKASGDRLRLLILRVLRNDSFGVSELCAIFEMRQPALSHHLKILANAGLITARREGNSIFYSRNELGQQPDLEALQNSLLESVDRFEVPEDMRARLTELQQQREENSRHFFDLNADKFREQQDLISRYETYAESVAQLLRDAPLKQRSTALEVGPGDGAFLPELSHQFETVVAIDNARGMLTKAQARVDKAQLGNIQFVEGEVGSEHLHIPQIDCAVMNMVLHHTPDPQRVIRDVAGHLQPNGVMLITELCQHDQGWARENCGDLWLGFEPDVLTAWAESVGLHDIASVYLAQRNGFQVQVRLFGRA